MPHERDPLLPARSKPRICVRHRFIIVAALTAVSFLLLHSYGFFKDSKDREFAPDYGTPLNHSECGFCAMKPPPDKAVMPGLGIDLTDSYGTATIRLINGSFINIGPFYGDDAYKSTIRRLSLESSKHMAPPYNWWYDPPGGVFAGFDDTPREWKRRICKNLGWPASTDVANLASMMDQLRSAAQNAIGKEPKFDSAVVTSPDLVALYDEDLFDAAEYLDMDAHQETGFSYKPYLQSDWRYRRQPKHLYAAFVGYGFGVCSHYTSTHLCEQEEKAMPLKPVIAISFTQQGLQLEHHFPDYSEGLITAHTAVPDWQQHPSWYSSDLGFLKYPKDSHRVADKELFWTKVRHQINEWLVDVLGDLNVTDVLLLGESAGTERFKEEVMKAVMESDKQVEAPVIHGGKEVDPLFVASRGAAEMSRRIWEAPVWCGFPQQCWGDDAEPMTKTNQ